MKAITSGILIGAAALALGVAAWAGGGEAAGKSESRELADRQARTQVETRRLTEEEVRARVEAQGYKIRRMEREHDGYEVKAIDASGRKVELEVTAGADGSLIMDEDD